MKPIFKKTISLLTIGLLCCFFANAQVNTSVAQFKPLQSQGEFPSFLNEVLAASPKDNIYNVYLKNLISEGKILYGTELNRYIDYIADQLLVKNPDLRKEIDIYILEVPEVNAYSLKNGVVLINMGMLAQVTNEAELAFVIAHEIAHYSEHHGTLNEKNKSKDKDFISNYLKTHQYSRDQEFAADGVGLTQYFKKSPYSFEVLDGIYDVLLYSNLPFDEIPFERSEVETDFYSFPDNYYLKSVSSITNRSTIVDTFLTHPNIEKRRSAAKLLTKNFSNENRKKFVQPEADFYRVRDLARFSCIEYYLVRHQYDRAIYNIHVLQQQFPDNDYLENSLISAFYGASKHKNEGELSSTYKPYKEVEGEMQQVNYFLSKLTRPEYSLLTLRKAWISYRKHPENQYLESVVKDLIKDIFVDQKKSYSDFCDYPQGTKLEDITDTIVTENKAPEKTPENKYDRIKQQNHTPKVLPDPKFKTINYMLVDIHQDSLFRELVNDATLNAETYELLNNITNKNKDGIKNMVVAKPYYLISSSHSSPKSLRNAKQLQNMMVKSISKMGGEPLKIDFDLSSIENTKQYNNLVLMNHWMDDLNNGNYMEMRYHTSQYMDEVAKAMGSSKICQVFVSRQVDSWFSFQKFAFLMASVPCPYLWPASLTNCVFPAYTTKSVFVITDLLTGETDVETGFVQRSVMSKAYVNGFVYSELEKYIKGK